MEQVYFDNEGNIMFINDVYLEQMEETNIIKHTQKKEKLKY